MLRIRSANQQMCEPPMPQLERPFLWPIKTYHSATSRYALMNIRTCSTQSFQFAELTDTGGVYENRPPHVDENTRWISHS
jgi:hypothetical protein